MKDNGVKSEGQKQNKGLGRNRKQNRIWAGGLRGVRLAFPPGTLPRTRPSWAGASTARRLLLAPCSLHALLLSSRTVKLSKATQTAKGRRGCASACGRGRALWVAGVRVRAATRLLPSAYQPRGQGSIPSAARDPKCAPQGGL
jgi:hypothetical protein